MEVAKPAAKIENTDQHPAHVFYLVTLILLGIMVLFGFIAVFVPWVMKDIGVGQRAWAYPFKTCIQDTFSKVHAQSCLDNDFIVPEGVPLTGGNAQCKAFVLATIAFVFISVIGGVITLLLLTVIILNLWSRPFVLGVVTQGWLTLVCIAALLSWIMFICYAEKTCAPNSIFPVSGYSYGFILYIFASASALAAVVTGYFGLMKLKYYQPLADARSDEDELLPAFQNRAIGDGQYMYPYPSQPVYPAPVNQVYPNQAPYPIPSQVGYPAQSPRAYPVATAAPAPNTTPASDSFYTPVQYW